MAYWSANDDGIHSAGLALLARVAARFGETRVVEPEVEQSSSSHAITSSRPMTYRRTQLAGGVEAYRVNGTPADCVTLGLYHPPKADVALSGINLPTIRSRMSEPDFDTLITQALEQLPEQFRARLDTVAIVVDEDASPETLARVGARGLFGLYEGVPRTLLGASAAPVASKITIFRRPLELHFRDPASRAGAVRDTLFHEIAHHFGISNARLSELSAQSRRRPGASR